MNKKVQEHFATVLHHIYINPLEKCNLKCKICYTRKTDPILSNDQILNFVEKYKKIHELQTITFCGGEVFALAAFPALVNTLVDQGIIVQIITNGTIDKLDQFKNPNFINLIVSLDGIQEYHDSNRGEGNYMKSTSFMKKAHNLGFHLEVFSIITKQNLPCIDIFEEKLFSLLGINVPITYHPRKPPAYLMHHPVSNRVGEINGFDFLSVEEMQKVMRERNTFPPKNLGCYQVALVSDGRVYGCCEGVTAIGTIHDTIEDLTRGLLQRLIKWESTNKLHGCLGCTQSEFMCGIKQYLEINEKYEGSTTSLYS